MTSPPDTDRQLDLALRALPRSLPPSRDHWPTIAAQIAESRGHRLQPWLIAAGLALLLLPPALLEQGPTPPVEPVAAVDGAETELIAALLELDLAHREVLIWSRRAPTNGGLARLAGRIEAHRTELMLYRSHL